MLDLKWNYPKLYRLPSGVRQRKTFLTVDRPYRGRRVDEIPHYKARIGPDWPIMLLAYLQDLLGL